MSRESLLFLPDMDVYTETDGVYHQDSDMSMSMEPTLEEQFMLDIEEHFKKLTDRQVQIVRLSLAGKSYRQMGKILGIRPDACCRHMQAAVKRLRAIAKELQDGRK